MAAPSIKTATLGCRVNQYETEFVRQGLVQIGWRDAAADEPADLCVVNTCTVTAEGDAKSRQTIRQLAKKNPDARIVVMGCYATRAPDEVASLPGVVEVVKDKRELPDLLGRFGVVDVPTGLSHFAGRKRAYVKVQDGCLLRCSFCIIPSVRPVMSSRPVQDILDEASRLADAGHREIVLTGIHLGHYGVDRSQGRPRAEWTRLSHLLERLMQLPGDFRVRLSSIEATEVSQSLLEVMAAHPQRICPHLHVCLQSGSDSILRRMRRRWGVRRFVDRCRMAKELLDQPALTTDVIVGFPGETDADFEDTLRVCRDVGFSKIHAFPYSPRKGTDAASYSDQVAKSVKEARTARLAEVERELQAEYFAGLVGRSLDVLVEGTLDDRPGLVAGTACRYALVELPGDAGDVRTMKRVQITAVGEGVLIGRALGPAGAALDAGCLEQESRS